MISQHRGHSLQSDGSVAMMAQVCFRKCLETLDQHPSLRSIAHSQHLRGRPSGCTYGHLCVCSDLTPEGRVADEAGSEFDGSDSDEFRHADFRLLVSDPVPWGWPGATLARGPIFWRALKGSREAFPERSQVSPRGLKSPILWLLLRGSAGASLEWLG